MQGNLSLAAQAFLEGNFDFRADVVSLFHSIIRIHHHVGFHNDRRTIASGLEVVCADHPFHGGDGVHNAILNILRQRDFQQVLN